MVWGYGAGSRPRLSWADIEGFEADGVDPDLGRPNSTVFTFAVKVTDLQADPLTKRNLVLQRYGKFYKRLRLSHVQGALRQGAVYGVATRLPDGHWTHKFEVVDRDGPATGAPTGLQEGPIVKVPPPGAGGTAAVVSLVAQSTAAGAAVSFTLRASAAITVEVLNLAGRPVATICADQGCEAGMNTLTWSGASNRGLRVPSGLYLIRVTARDGDGGESSALATLALR